MHKNFNLLSSILFKVCTLTLLLFLLQSCFTPQRPFISVEERQRNREALIEAYMQGQVEDSTQYNSLAFGPLVIHKTAAFLRLDSLYEVKQTYLDNYQFDQLKRDGIDKQITTQKSIAEQEKNRLKYEMEHIYFIQQKEKLHVHHDYLVLNYNDSILVHDPFYMYKVSKIDKKTLINYLFELHFLSDKRINISPQELNFIQFYKERELELIRTNELNDFMRHVMDIMSLASSTQSIDFTSLSRSIAINLIKQSYSKANFVDFDDLLVTEDENNQVLYYELTTHWKIDGEIDKARTIIRYSPYLEPIDVNHFIPKS